MSDWPCFYVIGRCDHTVCGEAGGFLESYEPKWEPTTRDYCEADGHKFYGNDEGHGRCYCGAKSYPLAAAGPGGET